MSGYIMYINNVQMPITPSKLQLKIKGKNRTITLVNDGEINFLKLPSLTEITVPLLLPMLHPYGRERMFNPPEYYLGLFEQLITSAKSAQFILYRSSPDGRHLFDTDMTVSLESYSIDEDAANGLDVAVTLDLKQYKDFGTKTAYIIEPTTTSERAVVLVEQNREIDNAPTAQSHIVISGDCLWNIAKKYYGNGAQYIKIVEANKDKISNPNLIYPGQVLIIP